MYPPVVDHVGVVQDLSVTTYVTSYYPCFPFENNGIPEFIKAFYFLPFLNIY